MQYSELIKERYSTRKFRQQEIEAGMIEAILEAARLAPTANNNQPQRILVISGADNMSKLKTCTPYTFSAPMAFVVCYNKDEAWVRPYDNYNSGVIDASIVATHMLLAIHDLGLGSTWVGHFDPEELSKMFNLPEHIKPVTVLPVGYPAPDSKPAPMHTKRHSIPEIVTYDKF